MTVLTEASALHHYDIAKISIDSVDYGALMETFQEIGLPAVGMRLERLWDWQAPELANLKQHWLGLEAPAPLDRIP